MLAPSHGGLAPPPTGNPGSALYLLSYCDCMDGCMNHFLLAFTLAFKNRRRYLFPPPVSEFATFINYVCLFTKICLFVDIGGSRGGVPGACPPFAWHPSSLADLGGARPVRTPHLPGILVFDDILGHIV